MPLSHAPRGMPSFCRPRAPTADARYNAEAVADGRVGRWEVPAGSRLLLSAQGELLELLPAAPVTYDGLAFAAERPVSFVWGRPFRGTLAEDAVLAGTPCRAGVETQARPVDGGWYPLDGTLAAEATLDGFAAMAGTRFQRLDVAALVLFTPPRDVVIDGVPCKAGAPVRRSAGRLSVATLAEDRAIDGVPCAGGGPVHLDARGLKHALLRETWVARGAAWRAGTLVSGALRDGDVREGTLDADAAIDGLPLAGGHAVRRDGDGRLRDFTLARDATVDGFPCRAGTRVCRAGVRTYTLGAPKSLRGIAFEAGDVVTIDEWDDYDAGVPTVRLATPRTLRGRRFPAGSVVYQYGWLCRRITVRLGDAAAIDGVVHPAETLVEFGRGGAIVKVTPPRREGLYRGG